MTRIRFILKSGRQIYFNCEEVSIKAINNSLTGCGMSGIDGSRPLYINMDEVAAIIHDGDVPEEPEDQDNGA